MTEHDLQSRIRIELSKHGICFRINNGAFYTKDGRYIPSSLPKGFTDIIFIRDGRAYFIEVKVKPNKATKEQAHFIKQIQRHGCGAGVAYSVEDALAICGVDS